MKPVLWGLRQLSTKAIGRRGRRYQSLFHVCWFVRWARPFLLTCAQSGAGKAGEGRVSVLQVTSWGPVLTAPRWDWPCPCAGLRLLDCEKWDPCWEDENTERFWRGNHQDHSLDLGVLCVDLYIYRSFTLYTRYFVLGPLTDLFLILFCYNFILCWFLMPFF